MNKCPHCSNEIPLSKFVWVTNFNTIKCPHCKVNLYPDKKTLSIIGGISGFSTFITVVMAYTAYLSIHKYGVEILILTTLLILSIFIATLLITRNTLSLTFKN